MNYVESEKIDISNYSSFEHTEFVDCLFENLDLCDVSFRGSKFVECKFVHSNCSNITILNTTLRDVEYHDCKIIGVNWSSSNTLSNIRYYESNMNYSIFEGLNLSNFIFKNCSLREVDFSSSNLKNVEFCGSSLKGSSFSRSNLSAADFRGAEEYFIDPKFTQITKAKFSMPEALVLLSTFDIEIE